MTLKDHIFHIVSADEFTLMYMEQHPSEVSIIYRQCSEPIKLLNVYLIKYHPYIVIVAIL